MLAYYEVYVGIKGNEYSAIILSTSNSQAENDLLDLLITQGINISEIDYCVSCTLFYLYWKG